MALWGGSARWRCPSTVMCGGGGVWCRICCGGAGVSWQWWLCGFVLVVVCGCVGGLCLCDDDNNNNKFAILEGNSSS